MLICKFCNKECKNNNSLINHERLCKQNPNKQQTAFANKEIQKTRKKSNSAIKAKELGKDYAVSPSTKNKISYTLKSIWTPERKLWWSDKMKIQARKNVENHPESYSYNNFLWKS